METRSITLYSRPECELCVEALEALRQIAAASPTPLVISEVNVEEIQCCTSASSQRSLPLNTGATPLTRNESDAHCNVHRQR